MFDWLSGLWSAMHLTIGRLLLGALFFIISSVGGLAIAALFVVNMPPDYFVGPRLPAPDRRGGIHGFTARLVKNLLGGLVIVIGLILALPGVPGPGVLVMLIGLMLTDFPGKHRIERWLAMRPGVLATMNRLRDRFGKEPMRLEAEEGKNSDA